jgi:hypothetical protein
MCADVALVTQVFEELLDQLLHHRIYRMFQDEQVQNLINPDESC